jgi:hypothetical protein
MRIIFASIGIATIALSGCATKRYPIATELSAAEAELLNCRELALEMAKTEKVQSQITDTATTDWRSVAGFLGDYGIGNAMAKSEAEKALAQRVESIRSSQARKGCGEFGASANSGASEAAASIESALTGQ